MKSGPFIQFGKRGQSTPGLTFDNRLALPYTTLRSQIPYFGKPKTNKKRKTKNKKLCM